MKAIAILVTTLFLLVTFNAYACLVPTSPSSTGMSAKCPSNDEQPTRSVCDAVKVFEAQTISSHHPLGDLASAHLFKDLPTTASLISSSLINRELPQSSEILLFSQARSIVTTTVLRI